jgi:hypothetical protein
MRGRAELLVEELVLECPVISSSWAYGGDELEAHVVE